MNTKELIEYLNESVFRKIKNQKVSEIYQDAEDIVTNFRLRIIDKIVKRKIDNIESCGDYDFVFFDEDNFPDVKRKLRFSFLDEIEDQEDVGEVWKLEYYYDTNCLFAVFAPTDKELSNLDFEDYLIKFEELTFEERKKIYNHICKTN